ncbi:unnamed protein product [Amoebophrya sp. A120]|nr:unnamed protein product [Amoebophrya sp. A120]|eukprot:GSA120T00020545001.1
MASGGARSPSRDGQAWRCCFPCSAWWFCRWMSWIHFANLVALACCREAESGTTAAVVADGAAEPRRQEGPAKKSQSSTPVAPGGPLPAFPGSHSNGAASVVQEHAGYEWAHDGHELAQLVKSKSEEFGMVDLFELPGKPSLPIQYLGALAVFNLGFLGGQSNDGIARVLFFKYHQKLQPSQSASSPSGSGYGYRHNDNKAVDRADTICKFFVSLPDERESSVFTKQTVRVEREYEMARTGGIRGGDGNEAGGLAFGCRYFPNGGGVNAGKTAEGSRPSSRITAAGAGTPARPAHADAGEPEHYLFAIERLICRGLNKLAAEKRSPVPKPTKEGELYATCSAKMDGDAMTEAGLLAVGPQDSHLAKLCTNLATTSPPAAAGTPPAPASSTKSVSSSEVAGPDATGLVNEILRKLLGDTKGSAEELPREGGSGGSLVATAAGEGALRKPAQPPAPLDGDGLEISHDQASDWRRATAACQILLDDFQRKWPLAKSFAREMVEQGAKEVALLHSIGIEHGDVKLENMLVAREAAVAHIDTTSAKTDAGGGVQPEYRIKLGDLDGACRTQREGEVRSGEEGPAAGASMLTTSDPLFEGEGASVPVCRSGTTWTSWTPRYASPDHFLFTSEGPAPGRNALRGDLHSLGLALVKLTQVLCLTGKSISEALHEAGPNDFFRRNMKETARKEKFDMGIAVFLSVHLPNFERPPGTSSSLLVQAFEQRKNASALRAKATSPSPDAETLAQGDETSAAWLADRINCESGGENLFETTHARKIAKMLLGIPLDQPETSKGRSSTSSNAYQAYPWTELVSMTSPAAPTAAKEAVRRQVRV